MLNYVQDKGLSNDFSSTCRKYHYCPGFIAGDLGLQAAHYTFVFFIAILLINFLIALMANIVPEVSWHFYNILMYDCAL